jgi:hypothetical protein
MYFSCIIVILTTFNHLIHCDNNISPSRVLSKNHDLPLAKVNETHDVRSNIIVRMFAFGIRRSDDDEEGKKTVDMNSLLANNDCCDDKQTRELQKKTRLLLLPLMIRLLLARIADRANTIEKSNGLYEVRIRFFSIECLIDFFFSKINNNSKTMKVLANKQSRFYANIEALISTRDTDTKNGPFTIIVFSILSCVAFFLIISL